MSLSGSIYNSAICGAAIFDFRYFRFCSLFTLVNFGIFHQPFAIRGANQFIAYQLHIVWWPPNGLSCLYGHICICSRAFLLRKKSQGVSYSPSEQRASKSSLRLLPRTRLVERRLSNLDLNDFSHCHPLIQEDKVEKPAE